MSSRGWRMRAGSTVEQQLDEMLLNAVNLHHDRHGDFLQVRALPLWCAGPLLAVPLLLLTSGDMFAGSHAVQYCQWTLRWPAVQSSNCALAEGHGSVCCGYIRAAHGSS